MVDKLLNDFNDLDNKRNQALMDKEKLDGIF